LRRFLAVVLLAVAASSASAQAGGAGGAEPAACVLTAAAVPDVRGLRLGLTTRHVFELFPGSAEGKDAREALAAAPKNFGAASVVIKPADYAPNPSYDDVSSVNIKFIDGLVAEFTVTSTAPEWQHVDDFVANFVQGTRLPPADAWAPYVGMDTQLKNLTCKGFKLGLFAGGKNVKHNYVKVTDTEADGRWRERRTKARQAAKGAKP
jgi:hypothetical protein